MPANHMWQAYIVLHPEAAQAKNEAFFRHEFSQYDLPFTKDIAVVCEEFEVVYP